MEYLRIVIGVIVGKVIYHIYKTHKGHKRDEEGHEGNYSKAYVNEFRSRVWKECEDDSKWQ